MHLNSVYPKTAGKARGKEVVGEPTVNTRKKTQVQPGAPKQLTLQQIQLLHASELRIP